MQTRDLLRALLLAVAIVLVQGTWALASTTGTIEGRVTDTNGNGINAAKVTASSPSQTNSSTTGSNGFYAILDLSPDTYSVTASKDGYDTTTTYGVTVVANETTAADLRMPATVKTIGHVTTTATATVVSKTVTGDLYAVNAQAISRYQGGQGGAETLYSQNGVVGSLPGVVRLVGSGGGYFGQGTLSLRGGSFDQVGYELDGIPLNRGFDFYNGTNFLTNGIGSLEVYTGGAPTDEGRAMSGFVNEIIQRGRYPGGATFTEDVGSPVFNHTLNASVYGGTPDNRFSYYVSTLAENAYYNFGDRSNLANYSFTVPANDPGCNDFNQFTPPLTRAISGLGPNLNCGVANSLFSPVSQGAYGSNPFASQRDTATNLHWAFPHNGLNDDLQALYVVGTGVTTPYGLYGTNGADCAQASSCGASIFAGVGVGPGRSLLWPVGFFYRGSVGQPYNPASLLALTWPSSGNSFNPATGTGGPIPANFNDSTSQQYSIEKFGYTRALSSTSILKLIGYKMFSYWNLDQPINGFVGFSYYTLHDNATGGTIDYENQINPQNLVKLTGDWSRDLTLRYNYCNWTGGCFGGQNALQCNGGAVACGPGTTVTSIGDPSTAYNFVTPLDWDGVFSDAFRPSDKLLFNVGVRWDEFRFQMMPLLINGPGGLAEVGEKRYGTCLDGFNYSAADTRNIGTGAQNCFDILTARAAAQANPVVAALVAPGGFAWTDVTGSTASTFLSPRFGLTFTASPRDVIRISAGRYVQPPNGAFTEYQGAPWFGLSQTTGLLNSFLTGLGFGAVHPVKAEDSTNYDLSLEHEFTGGFSAKITPFYRNTRNQVLTIPFNPAAPSFVTGYNFGAAHISGIEFLAQKVVTGASGLGGTLGVTFTNSAIQFYKQNGTSLVDVINGIGANGKCAGIGICGYNAYYGTNYPLESPSAYYPESFVQFSPVISPSFDVHTVVNLTVDARAAGFDVSPTFNYQSGNPYGDPQLFPDNHCAAPGPAPAGSNCIPLPAGKLVPYGIVGPDPYTNQFDALGSLKGPSWWSINVAIAHDIGHNLRASILGTNLLSGIHNQGYPWESPANLQNINYSDNGFYKALPLGSLSPIPASPVTAYYGTDYYPYASSGILPVREYIFNLTERI